MARWTVAIANDDSSRAKGLMGVKKLGSQEGMAFQFDASTTGALWMKDTLIGLDIAFWDADGKIVSVMHMTPCKHDPCRLYQAKAPYVGALEVKAGAFAKRGVRTGDVVTLDKRS